MSAVATVVMPEAKGYSESEANSYVTALFDYEANQVSILKLLKSAGYMNQNSYLRHVQTAKARTNDSIKKYYVEYRRINFEVSPSSSPYELSSDKVQSSKVPNSPVGGVATSKSLQTGALSETYRLILEAKTSCQKWLKNSTGKGQRNVGLTVLKNREGSQRHPDTLFGTGLVMASDTFNCSQSNNQNHGTHPSIEPVSDQEPTPISAPQIKNSIPLAPQSSTNPVISVLPNTTVLMKLAPQEDPESGEQERNKNFLVMHTTENENGGESEKIVKITHSDDANDITLSSTSDKFIAPTQQTFNMETKDTGICEPPGKDLSTVLMEIKSLGAEWKRLTMSSDEKESAIKEQLQRTVSSESRIDLGSRWVRQLILLENEVKNLEKQGSLPADVVNKVMSHTKTELELYFDWTQNDAFNELREQLLKEENIISEFYDAFSVILSIPELETEQKDMHELRAKCTEFSEDYLTMKAIIKQWRNTVVAMCNTIEMLGEDDETEALVTLRKQRILAWRMADGHELLTERVGSHVNHFLSISL